MKIGKMFCYIFLMGVTGLVYILWRMKIFSPEIHTFMSNWGAHGFGTYGYTLLLGFSHVLNRKRFLKRLLWVALISTAICTTGELLQFFDPTRVVDKWDLLAQFIGCTLASATMLVIGPYTQEE